MEQQVFISMSLAQLEPIFKQWIRETNSEKEEHKPKDKLLNVEQAASFLGLSKSTIYNKVSKSRLPSMKEGKRLYFSESDLMQHLKKNRRSTKAELESDAHNFIKKN